LIDHLLLGPPACLLPWCIHSYLHESESLISSPFRYRSAVYSRSWKHRACHGVVSQKIGLLNLYKFRAVVFNLFCSRTPRYNFSSTLYPQSFWCIIQVIHSL
jgi:hypothetical protein